jgi:uncharacterized protein (TIGR02145 family)
MDNINGTSGSHIMIMAYPGETPILNGVMLNSTSGQNVGLGLYDSSYIDFVGLTIINVTQHAVNAYAAPGVYESNVHHITHTQFNITHCGDGFALKDYFDEIYYTNCDVYEIADTFDDPSGALPGSLANGFYCAANPGTHVYYTGCRAWNCSDDGWDFMHGNGYIEITNCWAFNNGYCPAGGPIEETFGDGSGFKLGPSSVAEGGYQRILKNCLSIANYGAGVDINMGAYTNVPHAIYNTISAYNTTRVGGGTGIGFQYYNDHLAVIRNCASFGNSSSDDIDHGTTVDHYSNTATFADFASIDIEELKAPRQADGSLPLVNAFHLVTGSTLIGAGLAVGGLTTDGDGNVWNDPPSIGAFEYNSVNPPATTLAGSIRGYATVLMAGTPYNQGWVPDSNDFTLQDVCNVVLPPVDTLEYCFMYAIDCWFDPVYKGNKDRLSNFRNYGPRPCPGMSGVSNGGATVTGTLVAKAGLSGQTNGEATVGGLLSKAPFIMGVSNGLATVTGTLVASNITYKRGYGALYNWFAAVGTSGLGQKNIAPAGWHVPSQEEWFEFISFGLTVVGGYMKEAGYMHWNSPNTGADNSLGFNAYGSGIRSSLNGSFSLLKLGCDFWGSDDYDPLAQIISLIYDSAQFYGGSSNKKQGSSIRLIKDDSNYVPYMTDRDGNNYPVVKIGNQVWMASNFDCHSYNDGTPIPEVIPDAEWAALTTGAYCYYGDNPDDNSRISGQTNGVATVSGLVNSIVKRMIGIVHAGAGEFIGPYGVRSPRHAFSNRPPNGYYEYGFSFIPQTNLIFTQFTAEIYKAGNPNFVITFTLATANANGTPNTDLLVVKTINASQLSSTVPLTVYSYSNYVLTAGTRYVIYMTYSEVVRNNNNNKVLLIYSVYDGTPNSNVVYSSNGGSWGVYSTGEAFNMSVWLGGVIGTLTEAVPILTEVNYGLLYNWWVVDDARGIANTGWSVPTWEELNNLELNIGLANLKEAGTLHWDTNNGVDTSKFSLVGGGYRDETLGVFGNLKFISAIWASNSWDVNPVRWSVFDYLVSGWGFGSNFGCSIRLIKDSTDLEDGETGTYTGNDGKVYPTICIGTQEWLACNLAETKYSNDDNSDLISGWVNVDFSSLSSNGLEITSAIAGVGYYKIRTNWFHLSAGDSLNYSFDFNLVSGAYPYFIIFKNNTNMPFYAGYSAYAGLMDGSATIDEEADYAIGFVSWGAATEFNVNSLVTWTANHPKTDVIPEVTDNDDWANLNTGAMCAYDNDWDNV